MPLKRCPVCKNIGRAWGKKTCGAPECIREWKTWNAATRIRQTFLADFPNEEYEASSPTVIPSPDRMSNPSVADEALKSIFGEKLKKEPL